MHLYVALTSLLDPKPQSLCKHRSLSITNLAVHTHPLWHTLKNGEKDDNNFVTYINSNLPPHWTTACTRNLQKTNWRPNLAPNSTGIWANPWACSHRPPDNGMEMGTAFSAATTSKDKKTFVDPAVMMTSLAQHFQGLGSKVSVSPCNVATADARKVNSP